MTILFALTLGLGVILLLLWLAGVSIAENVDEFAGPEERFGVSGRLVPAGFTAFGIAGMSATFAGWAAPLALAAAIVAALAAAAFAVRWGDQG